MYFPIGWPKHLSFPTNQQGAPVYIISNKDRSLFIILTENCLTLWFCKPSVQILSHRRSDNSVSQFGTNQKAEWKSDASMIVVTTSKGYLLFFRLELDTTVGNKHSIFVQHDHKKHSQHRDFNNMLSGEGIPALKLSQLSYLQILGGISSMICIRDELLICTCEGILVRLRWENGFKQDSVIDIKQISFSVDLQQSRASTLGDAVVWISHIEYSALLGGFAVILSDGRGAFLAMTTTKIEASNLNGVWAQEVTGALSLAVNHKYRLIAFGCKSGEGKVYLIEELTGALHMSHQLRVSTKEFPDAALIAGPLKLLKWSPDGVAIAAAWEKGGIALWSVFGSLLFCSLGIDAGFLQDIPRGPLNVLSMEWGAEGYHLWIAPKTEKTKVDETEATTEGAAEDPAEVTSKCRCGDVLQMSFVKSALSVNPCMSNHEHLFLHGEDRVYLNTGDCVKRTNNDSVAAGKSPVKQKPRTSSNAAKQAASSVLIGNKQWTVLIIPENYLASNWPIRYASIDKAGHCFAIAGRTGLAHYALFNRKWKLFGNETQEKDMVVSGGITWWRDFICLSCYNLLDQRDEIRFYPRNSKLDNAFGNITKVPSQILLLNTFRDILIVLCADSHIMMYSIIRRNTSPNASVELTRIQEVSIGSYIPHPACVTAITLTSLRTETASIKIQQQTKEAESIMMNVSGKLLMFQRDKSGPQIQVTDGKYHPLPFIAPAVVASSVENMWSTSRSHFGKTHLMEALWLGCGEHGMKVWLPLFPRDEDKRHAFMSKRIMLPFSVNIYPLAVLFEDAVVLGAASDILSYDTVTPSASSQTEILPFCILERTSQVYLDHVLRQLLRRNLGFNALEIANCCTELPYFAHVLELLLHNVLEVEATSKDPIPDPLLPRVVAFIREFPEYLQTVVHCARKTEIALWHYLFSTVGNPKDLFEECLVSGALETAGSYLLILQNLEKPIVSRQHATLLLDAALEHNKWELARDLLRFLKAIDVLEPDPLSLFPCMPCNDIITLTPLTSNARLPANNNTGVNTQNACSQSSNHRNCMLLDPSEAEAPPVLHHTPLSRAGSKSSAQFHATHLSSPPISPEETHGAFAFGAPTITRNVLPPPKQDDDSLGKVKKIERRESQSFIKSQSPVRDENNPDQFFIDVILNRHARKLLSSFSLRHLGCFAANLEDYQLVSWLRKERVRSAKVEDFVSALKQQHIDFQWPFPILTHSSFYQLNKSFGANKTPSSPSKQKRKEPLDVDLGDGFLGNRKNYSASDLLSDHSDDIELQPQLSIRDDASSMATTEMSLESGSFLEDMEGSSQSGWEDALDNAQLEIISNELANKGPSQSEVELRYLLQILLEAGCLEWALIISIILRDAEAVARVINTASMTDTLIEIVGRMREGMSFLERWSETECLGYRPFLQAIRSQTQTLNQIAEHNHLNSRLSISSNESVEQNLDIDTTSAQTVEETRESPERIVEEDQGSCRIS